MARAGHDGAFAEIVKRYRPELIALARRMNAEGRSEDIAQQAFLSALVALRSGTEVRHLRGWLFQITRNAVMKGSPSRELPLEDDVVAGETLEELVQQRALALTALSAVGRLPERQRDALLASALGGRRRAELAASLGISEAAVRQLVHRARTAVRTAMTAVTPWPLVRGLSSWRSNVRCAAESGPSAAALTSGGIAVKLGALLTTGALVTGLGGGGDGRRDHAPRIRAAGRAQVRPTQAGGTERAFLLASAADSTRLVETSGPLGIEQPSSGRYRPPHGRGLSPSGTRANRAATSVRTTHLRVGVGAAQGLSLAPGRSAAPGLGSAGSDARTPAAAATGGRGPSSSTGNSAVSADSAARSTPTSTGDPGSEGEPRSSPMPSGGTQDSGATGESGGGRGAAPAQPSGPPGLGDQPDASDTRSQGPPAGDSSSAESPPGTPGDHHPNDSHTSGPGGH